MEQKYILSGILLLAIGVAAGLFIGSRHTMSSKMMMHSDGGSMTSMMHDMNASLEGKTGNEFDQAFLQEMIIHHQGAIDMARLAQTNASHQEIKDLSAAIIKAQTTEIAEMKAWQELWFN